MKKGFGITLMIAAIAAVIYWLTTQRPSTALSGLADRVKS